MLVYICRIPEVNKDPFENAMMICRGQHSCLQVNRLLLALLYVTLL